MIHLNSNKYSKFSVKESDKTRAWPSVHKKVEKSYNKTVIDFHFGKHTDLSTLKSDIHVSLFRVDNSYVYLTEVNNCIIIAIK